MVVAVGKIRPDFGVGDKEGLDNVRVVVTARLVQAPESIRVSGVEAEAVLDGVVAEDLDILRPPVEASQMKRRFLAPVGFGSNAGMRMQELSNKRRSVSNGGHMEGCSLVGARRVDRVFGHDPQYFPEHPGLHAVVGDHEMKWCVSIGVLRTNVDASVDVLKFGYKAQDLIGLIC